MNLIRSAHTEWESAWNGSCSFGDPPLPTGYMALVYIPQSFSFDSSYSGELSLWQRDAAIPIGASRSQLGRSTPTITEFEQIVREFKLQPNQYIRSTRLREWASRNKNSKYIPEPLLEAWGFEIESTL